VCSLPFGEPLPLGLHPFPQLVTPPLLVEILFCKFNLYVTSSSPPCCLVLCFGVCELLFFSLVPLFLCILEVPPICPPLLPPGDLSSSLCSQNKTHNRAYVTAPQLYVLVSNSRFFSPLLILEVHVFPPSGSTGNLFLWFFLLGFTPPPKVMVFQQTSSQIPTVVKSR